MNYKKRSNDSTLEESINLTLNRLNLTEKMEEAELKNNWALWMGKTIDKYTNRIALKNGTLKLFIEVGPLKQELTYSKDKIKNLINEHFNKETVKQIEIY